MVLGAMVARGGPAWAALLSSPPVVVVGWLAGENTRARRLYAREMVERAAERERERADRALRAVADERLRIARDLHDIVAHAMTVVAIRSGVARVVLDTQPEEAREALRIIETTSKRALAEMRLMVGVLREPDEGAELGPAPGLADLPELIEQVNQSGVDVEVDFDGDGPTLPAGVDLSAYRIIQEALTNVVRHAGPTSAHLTVRHRQDHLEIEIVDEGARNGRPPVLDSIGQGQGHGLVGMRERVGLFGGDLSAAPAGAGFRVFASLPLDEATR
jgi:signal transduction histidine kinase